jgi:hypothetical protein
MGKIASIRNVTTVKYKIPVFLLILTFILILLRNKHCVYLLDVHYISNFAADVNKVIEINN